MGAGGRWAQVRPLRSAAVGSVLVAGVLSGGAGAAVAQTANVGLTYSCNFPSGAQQVGVQIKASLPTAGTVGQTVSPGPPTVTVTVPRAAFVDATKLGATSVGATEKLSVNVTQSGATSSTSWQSLVAAQTALPSAGDLALDASGVAQGVRPVTTGKLAFAAGPLTVDLLPRKADGTATNPPVISLTCAPAGGSDTTIGTVAVSGAAQQAATPRATTDNPCPPKPTGGLNPKFPRPPIPSDDPANFVFGGSNLRTCATLAGFSNINKLNGSASLGGIAAVAEGIRTIQDTHLDYTSFENISVSNLEPRRATLLTFGFVPVSATMELTQIGNMNIVTVGPGLSVHLPTEAIAQGEVSLRLTDAHVNGVPLNLGPNCRSAQPVELTLRGNSRADFPYRVQLGGLISGDITIPAFKGCGVGEDLDPLLTASVSGPGNHVQILQGPLCTGDIGSLPGTPCPPVPFGFTVHPGGDWTAAAATFQIPLPDFQRVSCSFQMKGKLGSGVGTIPTPIAKVNDFSLSGCADTTSPVHHWTVTPTGLPWDMHATSAEAGITKGTFEDDALHFETPGCSFDATDNAGTPEDPNFDYVYVNSANTITLGGTNSLDISNVTGCTTGFLRPITNGTQIHIPSTSASFDPPQVITQP